MTAEAVARISPSIGRSLGALVLGAVAIGFAPIFVRVSEVGPCATAFWRLALALPLLLFWSRGSYPAKGERDTWRLLALAGAFFAGDLAFWHWSIHLTSVANATLEANLASVFVVVFGWLLWRERITWRFGVAMLIALGGTALLIGQNVSLTPQTLRGDALGVLTAIFYAGYLLTVKRARDRRVATVAIMAVSGIVSTAVLFALAWMLEPRLLPVSWHGWGVLLALALFSHACGQSLIAYALAGLPASFASLGLLIQPATAALVAWWWLGETLAPGQFVGAVLLMAGLYMARRAMPA